MRTTVTLDSDVAALVEAERARTGETFRQAINRLVRRGASGGRQHDREPPVLPLRPGAPLLDVTDASAVLAELDLERRAERDLV